MKTLLLLRHAQAGNATGKMGDEERPLTDAGFLEARRISYLLARKGIIPEKIISSHARRAISTAYVFAANFGSTVGNVDHTRSLYETGPQEYLNVISSLNDSLSSCLIVGHNHVITEVAGSLLNQDLEPMRTCEVLVIHSNAEQWGLIDDSECSLTFRVYPEILA